MIRDLVVSIYTVPLSFASILCLIRPSPASILVTMSIIITAPLLRVQLDQRVNTHNGNTCLNSRLKLFDLAHAGLEHTRLKAVVYLTVREIQTVVLVVLRFGELLGVLGRGVGGVDCSLREGVAGAEVGDELGGILGCVDCERLGNGEESLGEGSNGQLLTGALEVVSVVGVFEKTDFRQILKGRNIPLTLPTPPSRYAEQSQQRLHQGQYVRSQAFASQPIMSRERNAPSRPGHSR
jgi:hypothetical protein